MGNDDIILELGDRSDLVLDYGENGDMSLEDSIPYQSRNYERLVNLPKINSVTLIGNKTSWDLHIQDTEPMTNLEIESIIASVFD